jgi:hypothetical protein
MVSVADSQTTQLLELLSDRGDEGVTPLEALYAIGCMRLAARVYDLRAEGWGIDDDFVKVTARNGRQVRVKRYRLVSSAAA